MAKESLALQFAGFIEYVAQYKAEGLYPGLLDELGRREEAQKLRFAIGVLDSNKIMGLADKAAEVMRRSAENQASPTEELPETLPEPEYEEPHFEDLRGTQSSMFGELGVKAWWEEPDDEPLDDDLIRALLEPDPEQNLADMHYAFNMRKMKARQMMMRMIKPEVDRAWHQWLKDIGVLTPAQKFQLIRESAPNAILFLQLVGAWDILMESGELTADMVEELRNMLSESRAFSRDGSSSEGVTVYASAAALARDLAWPDRARERKKRY